MRIFLDSIGCRLNQSEIEKFAGQFRAAGHEIVSSPQDAELVVVNTCSVTAKAAADSRKQVRHAWRAGAGKVVVTGCWATLDPGGAAALPGVSRVFGNEEKDGLVSSLLQIPARELDLMELPREPLPGQHLRTRAFIKVQDGCDNHCTYCVTRLARGRSRSRSAQDVLQDVHTALAGGAKEIVLTGVQIGSWGMDLEAPQKLWQLAALILEKTDVQRLRLSSLEPWDLEEEFFALWKDSRLCRHLHLPLQSGSDAVLRRMARKTTRASFAAILEQARAVSPDIAITTDIIAGFPGESRAEFEESLEFVRRMNFAAGHVFSYSPRPGTPAAHFTEPVPEPLKKQRNAAFRKVLEESSLRYRAGFVGQVLPVLWEANEQVEEDGWHLKGLTDNYLRVTSLGSQPLWNQVSLVRLEAVTPQGMSGALLPSE